MDSIAAIAESMLSSQRYVTLRLEMSFWPAFAYVSIDTPRESTEGLFADL